MAVMQSSMNLRTAGTEESREENPEEGAETDGTVHRAAQGPGQPTPRFPS